ncbi:hypothetical protein B296_00012421 [Ensete ventricosum]|uniref:Uncharacterized protein n=1 Tax=Ensete ventricosum TaxID=4639 RepID=A0A426ZHE7_ENSVE|nr:hypothetical protein B296_00012421 [Ensete ventricosum]
MPKVSRGKTSSVCAAVLAREIGVSPVKEASKTSSKRPTDTPTEQIDDSARRHKKVKILSRRHKSCHGEGGSRSHSKGKEPAAPVKEPEMLVESDEEDVSPVHHRPRSMKDLFKTKVQKDDVEYYALYMSDLAHQDPDKEMHARWGKLKNSTKMALFDRVHDAGQLITFMDYRITNLQQEIDALKSGGGPEAVAAAEERTSELEKELEKTKRERDEALQRLEASDKELNEARGNLSEIQRLLKEARVRARKMDDELLQSVKALESARAELSRQAIDHFTVRPEDDLVPMERQQAFDDSDPPEP